MKAQSSSPYGKLNNHALWVAGMNITVIFSLVKEHDQVRAITASSPSSVMIQL